jgi:PepSY-associated TM region
VLKLLIITHRYLGMLLALPMLTWCLSGFVMMWVAYPNLDADQRVQAQPALEFTSCCHVEALRTSSPDTVLQEFEIEMLADAPIIRLEMAGKPPALFDLARGAYVDSVDAATARKIGEAYQQTAQLSGEPDRPQALAVDQWTVGSEFNRDRPLYRVALNDAKGTTIYISSRTGKIVQLTTAAQRVANYFGAVTHWIYPTLLRHGHPALWNWIMVILAAAGSLLTLLGITLGVVRLPRTADGGRLFPWRGWQLWHHILGLVFGVLTLAWVFSGLLSLNPGDVLASDYGYDEKSDIAGRAPTMQNAIDAVERLAARQRGTPEPQADGLKQAASAALGGNLYVVTTSAAGKRRLDPATLASAPIVADEVRQAIARLAPHESLDITYLPRGDTYLSPEPRRRIGPTFRAISSKDGSRYYVDAISGDLVAKYDLSARRYRWWFDAPHRWDFGAAFRSGPLWAGIVTLLLLGVTLSVASGMVLGMRRLTKLSHSLPAIPDVPRMR